MLEDLKDRWIERQKIRIILSVFILFFVSLTMSCHELRYLAWGKTTDATIVANRVDTSKKNDQIIQKRTLGYHYVDGEKTWTEYIAVPMDWTPDGATVKIDYIPGREISRLHGHRQMIWVYIFFGSLVLAAIGVYILSREK